MPTEILSIADLRSRVECGSVTIEDAEHVSLDPSELIIDVDDPNSEEYAEGVLQVWAALSGRSGYDAKIDEKFDLEEKHVPTPWPYVSQDPAAVASYMGAVAHTVGMLGCRPPSRVVELGSGWGHMALMIASTGFRTTAVDLNPASVELLRSRAAATGVDLEVVESEFLDYQTSEAVDCFVFYEAFHHCAYPARLISQCVDMLADAGRIVFVAEPFYESYHQPWGIRPDGHAAIITAREGWLELGYSWDYILELFLRNGLSSERTLVDSLGPAAGLFVVAKKGVSTIDVGTELLPSPYRATWGDASQFSSTGAFATADGSLLVLPDHTPRAVVAMQNVSSQQLQIKIEAGRSMTSTVLEPGATGELGIDVDVSRSDLKVTSSMAAIGGRDDHCGVLVEQVRLG